MVKMVATKRKLTHPLKKAAIIATPLAEKATPTLVVATAAPIAPSKRPRPKAETTGNVAQPQKCIKKKAKKGEWEIYVISSQITETTTLSIPLPSPVIQVSTTVPQDLSTPTMGQEIMVRPTHKPLLKLNQS
ncbi:hypothetical protein D8674_013452 [Pyrus ussuriensis x Pyrus communis]|uniref:Uncharacterized protein n=1 Tax=Pyrus ussuriensis x Pyrus communis TaxID=2448454 RepID=A0A5N5GSD6_9ROSA|nr:hypothetical protein D8674_013452 [Pyrus ussuriensis x Pyrus communis]